jgi:NAD+ synthase (glutamine-hydrolysing)
MTSPVVSVALAQINVTVGDLAGNTAKIVEFARRAHAQGARVVLTPELGLCGYPPEDLLLRPAFMQACAQALRDCAQALADLPDLFVLVGHPHQDGEAGDWRSKSQAVALRYNAASLLNAGRIVATHHKRELPNYQVFDERRYFASGRDAGHAMVVFEVGGLNFGVLICEDAWFDEPAAAAKAAGAHVLCVLNASPFHVGKGAEREARMACQARALQMPLLYAHLAGGQDEVVFDGASFALNADGTVGARAALFEEDLTLVQVSKTHACGVLETVPSVHAQVWAALVTGVRDYVRKNGFPGVLMGLSGGIDSALVLAIAVDALGAEQVRAVMMPSAYTADMSCIDARDMAQRLNVQYEELCITPMFEAFKTSLKPAFAGRSEDATEENLQARVRGTLLMALSNKLGSLVLTTGNKSEMATGYCTLYGDMAGGLAVLKDVTKTWVYELARWKNAQTTTGPNGQGSWIPERIITRAPSAELRPGQVDQDSLPPYSVLDAILQRHMEEDQSIEQIVAAGFHAADVERVTRLIKCNEYKRRQAPVGIRITHRAFGRDWRYPITSGFRA